VDRDSGQWGVSYSSKHAHLVKRMIQTRGGEHVLEAIECDQEQEAVGRTAIEMWVVVATCDRHWRFNLCKNVPHLNPNLLRSAELKSGCLCKRVDYQSNFPLFSLPASNSLSNFPNLVFLSMPHVQGCEEKQCFGATTFYT